jgi:hypothetical protein
LEQGYLDLNHPKHNTFKPMIWKPGRYEVIWRLQFFDLKITEREHAAIERRKKDDEGDDNEWFYSIVNLDGSLEYDTPDGDFTNPMRFPVWPDHNEPSYPGRPLLRLSAGYGRLPYAVADYSIRYGPGCVSVADQVLLETPELHLRLDHMVTSKQFHDNKSSGWLEIKSDGLFEVIQGQAPIFIVSNIDTGGWQGGFRFGGVELRRWQAPRARQGDACGTCKNDPSSTSRFSCYAPSL